MQGKDSPQSVIDAYRRRQQRMPFFLWGAVALLVVMGVIILVVWFAGPNRPAINLFASATPTSTSTFTPTPVTPTATATITPTATQSPTITVTATPSGPFEYKVQEKDTCWDIAAKYKVGLDVLLALNNFGNACPIKPGDTILIPQPGAALPTETALPTDTAKGTVIDYTVKSGDTLASIAFRFNTTMEAIMAIKENNLTDQNKIDVGQVLKVPVNLTTATPTRAPTKTPTPGGATKAATATLTATPK